MGLYRNLYFMSLVGATAGLFAWLFSVLSAAAMGGSTSALAPDLIAAGLLGGLIGGATVAFSDHRGGNPIRARFVVSGALIGIAAGLFASILHIPLRSALADQSPFLTRVIAWMLAGSFIGFGLGLRSANVNKARPIHAFLGGMFGGAAGGALFAALGSRVPDLTQALGFLCIGIGISAGITLAPILLRDGVLQFISSGDARAQSKLGPVHREWELQDGDSFVIGSESQDSSSTRYRKEVDIFIPDASIASRHATLFARDGRFYIARHPGIADRSGLARYVLRVRGKTVIRTSELNHADDISIGKTSLRFVARAGRGRGALVNT